MKQIIFMLALGLFFTSGCKKARDAKSTSNEEKTEVSKEKTEISFKGSWTRQFEVGPGMHTATYTIYQDSIRYKLSGPVGNADYTMLRDTFSPEDNRYIGHTEYGRYYLLFAKNVTADSISIYKQEIPDMAKGLTIEIPDDNTTANHGWNTYRKE